MKVTVTHLLSAAIMAGLVVAAMPSAVFAYYDYDDARHDQSIVNRLASQGAINPAQAALMDQNAINKANNNYWMHHNGTMMGGPPVPVITGMPLIGGIASAPMMAAAPMYGEHGGCGGHGGYGGYSGYSGYGSPYGGYNMPSGYLNHTQAHFEKAKVDELFRDHLISRSQQLAMKRQIDAQTYGNGGSLISSIAPALAGNMGPSMIPNAYPVSYPNNGSLWQRFHF